MADIDTGAPGAPDIDRNPAPGGLDALGDRNKGKKPSGMLSANGKLYAWVRNIKTDGTLRACAPRWPTAPSPARPGAWASWTLTQFGYPVFVQAGEAYAVGRHADVGASAGVGLTGLDEHRVAELRQRPARPGPGRVGLGAVGQE